MRKWTLIFIILLTVLLPSVSDAYTSLYASTGTAKTYDQVQADITSLLTANPTWSKVNFGTTPQSRYQTAVIINGSSYYETIVVAAGIHGNEKPPVLGLLDFMHWLSDNPTFYNNIRFIVAPLGNPDGYVANTRKNNNTVSVGYVLQDYTGKYGDNIFETSNKLIVGDSASNIPYRSVQFIKPTSDFTASLFTWSISMKGGQISSYKIVIYEATSETDTDPTGKVLLTINCSSTEAVAGEHSQVIDLAMSASKWYGICFVYDTDGDYTDNEGYDLTDSSTDGLYFRTDENSDAIYDMYICQTAGCTAYDYVLQNRFYEDTTVRKIDLNRNFNAGWGSVEYGEVWPDGNYYEGPSAASEPETQGLQGLLTTYSPQRTMDYHTVLNILITPTSDTWDINTINTYLTANGFDNQTQNVRATADGTYRAYNVAYGGIDYTNWEYGSDAAPEEINRMLWGIKARLDHRRYFQDGSLRLTTTMSMPISSITYNRGHNLSVVGTAADASQTVEITGLNPYKTYYVDNNGTGSLQDATSAGVLTISAGTAAEHTIAVNPKRFF